MEEISYRLLSKKLFHPEWSSFIRRLLKNRDLFQDEDAKLFLNINITFARIVLLQCKPVEKKLYKRWQAQILQVHFHLGYLSRHLSCIFVVENRCREKPSFLQQRYVDFLKAGTVQIV